MSSMPRTQSGTVTVSARSDKKDSSPPRNSKVSSNTDYSPERRHNSLRPQQQHFRRATETYNTSSPLHTSYTSPYLLAHASDAINELHPVRVQKYMDNFAGGGGGRGEPSSKRTTNQQQTQLDMDGTKQLIGTEEGGRGGGGEEEEEEDGFQRRISYLTEQFDKQSEINTKKFLAQNRHSFDSLGEVDSPRRCASLNFIPTSPTSGHDKNRANGTGAGGGRGGGGFEPLKKKSSGPVGKEVHRTASMRETEEDEEALFKDVS